MKHTFGVQVCNANRLNNISYILHSSVTTCLFLTSVKRTIWAKFVFKSSQCIHSLIVCYKCAFHNNIWYKYAAFE